MSTARGSVTSGATASSLQQTLQSACPPACRDNEPLHVMKTEHFKLVPDPPVASLSIFHPAFPSTPVVQTRSSADTDLAPPPRRKKDEPRSAHTPTRGFVPSPNRWGKNRNGPQTGLRRLKVSTIRQQYLRSGEGRHTGGVLQLTDVQRVTADTRFKATTSIYR